MLHTAINLIYKGIIFFILFIAIIIIVTIPIIIFSTLAGRIQKTLDHTDSDIKHNH